MTIRELRKTCSSALAAAAAVAAVCAFPAALPLRAAEPASPGVRTFDTARQAADALVQAAEANDIAAIVAMFGAGGKDIVPSGDPVKDKNDLARFAERARENMDISLEPGRPPKAILIVGDDDWPMPVPIVRTANGKWQFDAKQGRQEILARRIGGNELDAIALLRDYVDAQEEYASEDRDGSGIHQYAQKAISTPGKHDGLSWWNADKTPGGPLGEEVAKALAAGYTSKAEPYNGYYFRMLPSQGPAARLGARDYVVKGMIIGGFAAIAWPANYGVTGVQTFMVNNDGEVFQKDLGPETSKIAPNIKAFNPDKTWLVTEDAE
jgi:Protein of unknown function (DUF2950)